MKLPSIISIPIAILLLGLIGWAEVASWQEALELQKKLDSPDLHQLMAASEIWPTAHRDALHGVVTDSQKSLNEFRGWLLASCGGVLVLASLIAYTVHREMIAPLRESLLETHAVIARQEKLASLGVLAAGVAHEIRNPLTAIKARLFTQKKKLAESSPALSDANFINDEINRLEQIVKDFLLFARPSDPVLENVSVSEFLWGVHELMASEVERQQGELRIEPTPGLHARMDPAMMRQVLINLIRNAAESLTSGGTITLRARPSLMPRAPKDLPALSLEVEDTGPGIPAEVQRRLFDPFFTTKASGTGLGLAIAERITARHGGMLAYRTALHRGTTFSVILPALTSS